MRRLAPAVLFFVALALPCPAAARWPNGTGGRLRAGAEEVVGAAEAFSVDPVLLASLCAHETGIRPVRGGTDLAHFGPGQVRWSTWSELFAGLDLADEPEDLLDLRTGLEASAAVLLFLEVVYGAEGDRRLCLYGVGWRAMAWKRCGYSRDVLDNVPKASEVLR